MLLIYMSGFMKTVSIICAKSPYFTSISQLLKAASKPVKRAKLVKGEQ